MREKTPIDYTCDRFARSNFIKRNLRFLIFCVLVTLFLLLLLWGTVLSKLESDKSVLEQNARRQATSIADAYAQYLVRTVKQLDQLSQQIKYDWEKSDGKLTLAQINKQDLFNLSQFPSVAIFDAQGNPMTTTNPVANAYNVVNQTYFQFHKTHRADLMQIGEPLIDRWSGKKIIPITRRLENNVGQFAGVLVILVSPDYFTLFVNNPVLGNNGVMAFIGDDGLDRTASLSSKKFDHAPPVVLDNYTGIIKNSSQAQQYADGEIRFTATKKLDNYPFYALVGLSKTDVLAPYEYNRQLYHKTAIVGSLILLLFSTFACLMAIRLHWRKKQAAEIRETYRIATEGANEGFYILIPIKDRNNFIGDFEIVDCNEKGAAFFGRTKQMFLGKRISTFCFEETDQDAIRIYRSAMENGFYEDDYRVPAKSPIQAEWLKRRFVRSQSGLAVTLRDISEHKRHERELSRLAIEDGVTGLSNRHWLMNYLPQAVNNARSHNSNLAILFIDLDGFKHVNDTLGHAAGDILLREVSRRLQSVVRSTDKVARIGGDEFTVVLETMADEDSVAHIATSISRVLQQPFDLLPESATHRCRIGGSTGISMFPRDGQDADTLIKNADVAMYAAKTNCKGKYCFYDQLYDNIRSQLNTEQELQQAIKQDQFLIHYQPRVETKSGKLIGMEALLRWQHPERGLIMPDYFIALAEQGGTINAIGETVLDKVCAQLALWRSNDVNIVPISVNISVHQFNEGKLENQIIEKLEKYGIPARLLEIELTESIMMHDNDDTFEQISSIDALGVQIHVDDFGTGYSSLSLLQRLHMNTLKIDRSFTAQLGVSKDGEALFTAILSMAKALKMRVVAEGVENAEQLHILQTLDCDEMQGDYISSALPANTVVELTYKQSLIP